MTRGKRATISGDPNPPKGEPVDTCPKCHSEAWDQTNRRQWIRVPTAGGAMELPVLHPVNECRVCHFEWRDKRCLEENATAVRLWNTTRPCRFSEGERPFCLDCGETSALLIAIERGYYLPEQEDWSETAESEEFRWEYARKQVFGCRVKVPKDVTH